MAVHRCNTRGQTTRVVDSMGTMMASNEAIVKLSQDDLDEVIRILTDHIKECRKLLYDREANSTRELVKRFSVAKREWEDLPEPRVVELSLTIDEMLGNIPPMNLNVRAANALYLFCKRLEEARKRSPDHSADWWKGLPAPRTVGDLTKWSKWKLLGISSMGQRTVDYLERVLNNAGHQLRGE